MESFTQLFGRNSLSARAMVFKTVRSMALNNMEYFQTDQGSFSDRLYMSFSVMHEFLDKVEPAISQLEKIAAKYDLDDETPGNGYRSIVSVLDSAVLCLLKTTRNISLNRDSFLFRGGHFCRELEAYTSVLGTLQSSIPYLAKLDSWCEKGNLFAPEEKIPWDLMREVENLNQAAFYGRPVGFQFCESMMKPLQVVAVAMASFSDGFFKHTNGNMMQRATTSFLNSGKYLMNPELRSQQIVNVTKNASIHFCKTFWSITDTELLMHLPHLVCPGVAVNKVIPIPPVSLDIPRTDGVGTVTVNPPSAHSGPGHVNTRLISYDYREGQSALTEDETSPSIPLSPAACHPPSRNLILHCHGGGWVAQSSKSHEVYLRDWSKQLKAPILSIDYSLAPEHPFPRQLEEVFFAYCWALQNCAKLGSTCERIVVCGDSAGGNLVTCLTMRAIANGIRLPDGILAAYTPFLVQYVPSPSRLLCIMDPLLPLGILARLLVAYSGSMIDDDPHKIPEPTEGIKKSSSTSNLRQDVMSFLGSLSSRWSPLSSSKPSRPTVGKSQSSVNFNEYIKRNTSVSAILEDEKDEEYTIYDHAELLQRRNSATCFEMPVTSQHSVSGKKACTTKPSHSDEAVTFGLDETDNEKDVMHDVVEEKSISTGESENEKQVISEPEKMHFTSVSETGETSVQNLEREDRSAERSDSDDESPVDVLQRIPLDRNPYMSPLLAEDKILAHFPPMNIFALHLDPLLDDSVMFAKRLRSLNRSVRLHIVDRLPHGFLNFCPVSKDAKAGSDKCVSLIQNLLED